MDGQSQVLYRDAFLGEIQKHASVLDSIRFPVVSTFCRSSQDFPISALRRMLEIAYCDRGNVNIVSHSGNKLIFLFSDDGDAKNAYEELHDQVIGDFLGPIFKFKIWHPIDDLGYDIADHHAYISIQGLPLHLWKKNIVEQILHPHCPD